MHCELTGMRPKAMSSGASAINAVSLGCSCHDTSLACDVKVIIDIVS
jgi:hypothetical protein